MTATAQRPAEHSLGPPIEPLDSIELFKRWHRHADKRAQDELVRRYLPLARKLARRYQGANEPFEDLLQVASLGLVKAIDRFDYDRGIAFSSYAVPSILGELKRYFRDYGWSVHVARGAQERALRLEGVQRKLAALRGRPPSVGELAEYMELSVDQVLEALEAAQAHHSISLDTPRELEEEEAGTLIDSLGAEDRRFALIDAGATIAKAAKHLSERERRVLALRFIYDRTQSEIAERIGVSQMQVSRILRGAIDRLQLLTRAQERPVQLARAQRRPA